MFLEKLPVVFATHNHNGPHLRHASKRDQRVGGDGAAAEVEVLFGDGGLKGVGWRGVGGWKKGKRGKCFENDASSLFYPKPYSPPSSCPTRQPAG